MPIQTRRCTFRLELLHCERLAALASARDVCLSDVIRDAISTYLSDLDVMSVSRRRLARITEYNQLALDVIIREQFPEYRDRLVAETDRRLEQYHAGR